MEYLFIELDELDPQTTLPAILDVLEYYELYRLCLIICNRYSLSDRTGRYISAICTKYSNLNTFRLHKASKLTGKNSEAVYDAQ
jgi:hypothetical protein